MDSRDWVMGNYPRFRHSSVLGMDQAGELWRSRSLDVVCAYSFAWIDRVFSLAIQYKESTHYAFFNCTTLDAFGQSILVIKNKWGQTPIKL